MTFVDTQLAGIAQAQYALQTIASIWQLTCHKYPPPPIVNDGDSFDYIVVGAGSAGAVVAARLSEIKNATVLLLEAGDDSPIESNLPTGVNFLQNGYLDWNQQQHSQVDEVGYQCLRDKRQPVSHGKMVGGCSGINLMLYMRGHPHDYDRWANITGDPSWKYENVLKYFMKSERLTDKNVLDSEYGAYHGTDGPMGVSTLYSENTKKYIKSYEEMGYPHVPDLNANGTLGVTEQMVTLAGGERQSTANAHLAGAKGRSNLYVLRRAMATKILFNDDKEATGVVYLDKNNKTTTVYARKEVIVSAGFNSAQLLLLSGVGPKEHLEEKGIPVVADLPVGQQIINHHGIFLVFKTEKIDPTAVQDPVDPTVFPVPMVSGLLALNRSQPYPDYMGTSVVMNSDALAVTFCLIVFAFDKKVCQDLYDATYGREVLFSTVCDFNQKSRGHVKLKSADPLDPPDIHLVAYPDEKSFETILTHAEDFMRIVNTTYFQEVGAELVTLPQCSQYEWHTTEYLRCYGRCMSSTYYHYVALNAMGKVTDSRLRVFNTKKMRVCDSSSIPAITSGTTNAPTIMVGERCADMIKEDNGELL